MSTTIGKVSFAQVRSVQEYLERMWSIPSQPDTQVTLYRGQLDIHPLLPKLFRSPNTPIQVKQFETQMLSRLKEIARERYVNHRLRETGGAGLSF